MICIKKALVNIPSVLILKCTEHRKHSLHGVNKHFEHCITKNRLAQIVLQSLLALRYHYLMPQHTDKTNNHSSQTFGRFCHSLLKAGRALSATGVCVLCENVGTSVLCDNCHNNITKPEYDCRICGQALKAKTHQGCCRFCLAKPPMYEKLHYIGVYNTTLAELIIRAKINRHVMAIQALQQLTADFVRYSPTWGKDYSDYYLLPMPTPRWRLMQRGVNLPLIMAKTLSQAFALPVLASAAVTLPFITLKQAQLSRKQRLKNRMVYQFNHKLPQNIIIVDDIVTTGTTLANLSKQLRNKNVKSLAAWVIARTNVS